MVAYSAVAMAGKKAGTMVDCSVARLVVLTVGQMVDWKDDKLAEKMVARLVDSMAGS